jgi:hypothetical protein
LTFSVGERVVASGEREFRRAARGSFGFPLAARRHPLAVEEQRTATSEQRTANKRISE